MMVGTRRNDRFECPGCGGQIVYRSECPREAVDKPRCVCGVEMRPLAADMGEPRREAMGG